MADPNQNLTSKDDEAAPAFSAGDNKSNLLPTSFHAVFAIKDVLEAGTMPLAESLKVLEEGDTSMDLNNVDPVALAAQGTRRGSRYSADGTPLSLKAFLESANPSLNFQFQFREKPLQLSPLEQEYDRRVLGKRTRYEMFEGEFRKPEAFRPPTMPDGYRYRVADIYHLQIDPELVIYAGVVPGWQMPIVTEGNPHQEGLIDHHRALYLPYSEDKNTVMELPSSPGLFFTSQIISGGELIVAYDRSLHKSWVMHINQVYTPPKYPRHNELAARQISSNDDCFETAWRRAIENQAYCDRVLQLLTELGNNLEVLIRISPATQFFKLLPHEEDDKKDAAQQRLDSYFRDEIISSKGDTRHYYYEREAVVYGFFEDSRWKFGIKDRGRNNGYSIKMKSLDALYVNVEVARYPL